MSKLNEGYLCPECFLNLDSDSALFAHFEKNHGEIKTRTSVNHVTQFYKNLVADSSSCGSNSPKSGKIESLLNLLLDGRLTIENIPDIELKPKLQTFVKAQLERECLISQLSAELESSRENHKKRDEESEIGKLKAEIESYKVAIEALQVERDEKYQILRSQNDRVSNLEKDLAILTKECENSKAERKEIVSLLSLDENKGKSFIDQLKFAINDLKSRSTSVSQSVNSTTTEDGGLITDVTSLKTQLADLKLENHSLVEKSKNQEPLEQMVMELQKEISFLKDELEKRKALENQIAELKSTCEISRSEVQSLKASMENSNTLIDRLTTENSDLTKKIESLESVREGYQKEIESLRSSLKNSLTVVETLKNEEERLVNEIEHFKMAEISALKETESLKASLEKATAIVNELKNQNSDLSTKLLALSSEVDTKNKQLEELHHSLTETQEAVKRKDSSITVLNDEVKKCVSNLEVKSEECAQLTRQIESLNASIGQLSAKLQETEARLSSALESENALKSQLIEIEATLFAQRALLESHESTVAELEGKLANALAENQTLVDQIIEGQNKSQQLESVLQSTHQEMDGFQRIVLDLGRQNQALQIQLERMTNRQWESDDAAVACNNCNKEFTISIRKHHCRHCGKVFCNACSSKKTALAAFRDPQRVCDACFTELTR